MPQVLVIDMLKCVTFFFDFNLNGSASIDLYQGEGWFSLFTDPIRCDPSTSVFYACQAQDRRASSCLL